MKQIEYKGISYNVPSWTKWLAEDEDGTLCAFSNKPIREGGEWWPNNSDKATFIALLEHEQPVEVD